MTDSHSENAIELEPESPVIGAVVKEVGNLAKSNSDTVLRYILVSVVLLFMGITYLAWQSNASQPERLFTLLEKNVNAQAESLKIQEAALAKLQEFAIRVPMEHAEQTTRITLLSSDVGKVAEETRVLREAVLANTEAVAKLVEAMRAGRTGT